MQQVGRHEGQYYTTGHRRTLSQILSSFSHHVMRRKSMIDRHPIAIRVMGHLNHQYMYRGHNCLLHRSILHFSYIYLVVDGNTHFHHESEQQPVSILNYRDHDHEWVPNHWPIQSLQAWDCLCHQQASKLGEYTGSIQDLSPTLCGSKHYGILNGVICLMLTPKLACTWCIYVVWVYIKQKGSKLVWL